MESSEIKDVKRGIQPSVAIKVNKENDVELHLRFIVEDRENTVVLTMDINETKLLVKKLVETLAVIEGV